MGDLGQCLPWMHLERGISQPFLTLWTSASSAECLGVGFVKNELAAVWQLPSRPGPSATPARTVRLGNRFRNARPSGIDAQAGHQENAKNKTHAVKADFVHVFLHLLTSLIAILCLFLRSIMTSKEWLRIIQMNEKSLIQMKYISMRRQPELVALLFTRVLACQANDP